MLGQRAGDVTREATITERGTIEALAVSRSCGTIRGSNQKTSDQGITEALAANRYLLPHDSRVQACWSGARQPTVGRPCKSSLSPSLPPSLCDCNPPKYSYCSTVSTTVMRRQLNARRTPSEQKSPTIATA